MCPHDRMNRDFSLTGFALQSGLSTKFVHLATSKMKNCLGHLAPAEALPCSNEVRGSEA
ncbi:hypothetical protein QF042_002338 [Pedobacter sp. W3I1]|nr:hypothetical protein [Pedobacter sp. W3I1]